MYDLDFLLAGFVYLAVAVLAVPIAQRLSFGSVLGYLLAGILIGPFVLGIVGEENTDVLHFAEFGVVLMMFLIGLELQPSLLWSMRSKIVGLGGLQVTLSAFAIATVGLAFGLAWQTALTLGLTLALSSTAIVMQSLEEKGWMKSPAGSSAFNVLLFQDIAVIPILAFLPLLAFTPPDVLTIFVEQIGDASGHNTGEHNTGGHSTSNHDDSGHGTASVLIDVLPSWLASIIQPIAIVVLVLSGRLVVTPMFRAVANLHSREIFTALALAIVLGAALLMRELGLSMALGTFIAGVVLADSEYRHEIENTVEPFKGLLLGLFFISVGASIDFQLIWDNLSWIMAFTLGLLLVKLAILLALGPFFGLRGSQLTLFGFALAQGGEFAFVLFSFATQNQVLSPQITAPLTAVVALTMLVTPLMLIAYERLLVPMFEQSQSEREPDEVEDTEPEVLLAGYGTFGTLVGRFLLANRIRTNILDYDPQQIDTMRRFGFKVYYGDVTRIDLLELAGIAHAKMIVIAIGNKEAAVELARTVIHHYPDKIIVARAVDRQHYNELVQAGCQVVVRQYAKSSLELAQAAITALGFAPYDAYRRAKAFETHDVEMLEATQRELATGGDLVALAKRAREEIEILLNEDQRIIEDDQSESWSETEK